MTSQGGWGPYRKEQQATTGCGETVLRSSPCSRLITADHDHTITPLSYLHVNRCDLIYSVNACCRPNGLRNLANKELLDIIFCGHERFSF